MLKKAIIIFILVTFHSTVIFADNFTYKVKKGDTLFRIARRYNISVEDIKRLNNLKGNHIKVGQILVLKEDTETYTSLPLRTLSSSSGESVNEMLPSPPHENNEFLPNLRDQIVELALSFQGIPYKRGGMSFNGIDCSGLVSLIFKSFGIDVPRTAREQFLMGEPVEMEELKPGDLLFFFTQRTSLPGHVGIYVGNSLFVHASRSLRRVVVSSLEESYFIKRLAGIRRFINDNSNH
jgi:peptidoglycan endopeptidase LytE